MRDLSKILIFVFIAACGTDDDNNRIIVTTSNNANNVNNVNNVNNDNNANNGSDAGSDDSGTSDDMGSAEDMAFNVSEEVDPNCTDGQYREDLPLPNVDISAEVQSFSPATVEPFYNAILTKRFPVGAWVVQQGLTNPQFECVDLFSGNPQSADAAIDSLGTVVHECGHVYNFTLANDGFGITPALTITCQGGDTTERFGETFARSRLRTDDYNALRPPCDGPSNPSCDFYGDVYLDGNPDDQVFDGGDQGFNSVLEETLQYVNSLATAYAFQEYIGGSTSALDGILTFLWYIERYLRMARLQYPRAYAKLADDPCYRNAILTIWGRAWIMLEAAEGIGALGINDAALFQLVRDPELLGEIQRLRDKEGC